MDWEKEHTRLVQEHTRLVQELDLIKPTEKTAAQFQKLIAELMNLSQYVSDAFDFTAWPLPLDPGLNKAMNLRYNASDSLRRIMDSIVSTRTFSIQSVTLIAFQEDPLLVHKVKAAANVLFQAIYMALNVVEAETRLNPTTRVWPLRVRIKLRELIQHWENAYDNWFTHEGGKSLFLQIPPLGPRENITQNHVPLNFNVLQKVSSIVGSCC
jgi:hypothetical protein